MRIPSELAQEIESPFADGAKAVLCCKQASSLYRGEEYSYMFYYYRCERTGEEFTTTESDDYSIGQVHSQYRQRHTCPVES